ncbi:MAG TPA: HNH endonuclease [Bryobacteraceae bacterium]|jgi:hypothetical protein
MQEQWKAIPGFEGVYEASDQGRIRGLSRVVRRGRGFTRLPELIIKPAGSRYLHVSLGRDGVRTNAFVHRLVMSAFYGPSDLTVNHRNRIKTDNRLANLEYMTQTENTRDASFLTQQQAQEIRELYASGAGSQRALAVQYGVCHATIWLIVHGLRWQDAA